MLDLWCDCVLVFYSVFFFKQKTAYEMRISDWSSDVCSSDLEAEGGGRKILQLQSHRGRPVMSFATLRQTLPAPQLPSCAPLPHAPTASRSRSEERRVGKECVGTCRSRWLPYH